MSIAYYSKFSETRTKLIICKINRALWFRLEEYIYKKIIYYNVYIEISGDVLEKKLYKITEKEKDEFLEWLEKDIPMEKTPKDIFRLKMYFSNNLDLDTRLVLLEHQLLQHQERIKFLYSQMERYSEVPPLHSNDFGDYIVLDGAIIR